MELERSLKSKIFKKKLKQAITHPFLVFSGLLLYIWHSKIICSPPIYTSNDTQKTKKHSIWWRNEKKNEKMFSDRYMFDDGWFYPIKEMGEWENQLLFPSPFLFGDTTSPPLYPKELIWCWLYPLTSPQPHMKAVAK